MHFVLELPNGSGIGAQFLVRQLAAGFGSIAVRPKDAQSGAGGAGAAGGRAARGAAAEGRSTAASEQTRVTWSAQLENIA